MDLGGPAARLPIGMGCKVCGHADGSQRAFPPIGKAIAVDEPRSGFAPYPVVQTQSR